MEENKIVIYLTEDGVTKISVTLDGDTVWLTQAQMAELLRGNRSVFTRHLQNAFKEGEHDEERNVQILHIAYFYEKYLDFCDKIRGAF